MNIIIGHTNGAFQKYPPHSHDQWEIIFYTEGSGTIHLHDSDHPFRPGTAIFVPPGTAHHSTTESHYTNIYIRGDFAHLIMFTEPVIISDNEHGDGALLIRMIYRNRYKNSNYVSDLCKTYIHYLLLESTLQNELSSAIHKIYEQIMANAFDSNIDVGFYLRNSGYAEDYIRMRFKETVGMSPLKFLTKIRIDHACLLLEMYKDRIPLTHIAERCGYTDYVYFSKKFKEMVGVAPQKFVK